MPNTPIAAADLSELIGLIYDCAIDPDAWSIALPALRTSIDCYSVQLGVYEMPTARILLARNDGVSDYWLARQPSYGVEMYALWADVLLDPALVQDEPIAAMRVMSQSKLQSNRYYTEWVHAQGQIDAAILVLMRDATRIATAGFGRNAAAGLVGDRELDVLRLLAPHMRRAVTISNMLDAAKIAASSFESALDTLNVGIFLVNSETRIIHANLAARQMLVEGCPVRSILGKLQLAQPAATAALSAAIAKADGDEAGMGRSGIGVPTLGAGGQPHLAHVLPLRQGTVRQRLVPAAVAAVFIAPSQAGPPVPAAALGALYDLTPAEARILVDIAAGRTPSATALTLGVAEATVRTHLARVFAKTGTSRQADLVRLVASLNFPLRTSH